MNHEKNEDLAKLSLEKLLEELLKRTEELVELEKEIKNEIQK